ncbi:nuclear transport factor 2 family protein [Aggregicoccus sp. 17bor-14]|uniref:nuclear transport factor 2 family protein n=1 Tax=Myxococcaceae TaxID=31 RepID=UPI00129D16BA|nr:MULTISPECIES: nuclear transport factor 2 family protein [Myxococcaceae]MBF5046412.1 nuclear transport factor 2 family protein [Simulacricoccus sp. 17bor-14]MRI92131.1 nuclear transport factor 2 family protein [Aggregicoccus sp. 17bor-14]
MDANLQLIQEAYAAYARGDVAAVFSLLHPDVEIHQTPLLPWGGDHRGHAGARTFFQRLGEHTQAVPQPEQYLAAGDDVVAVGRLRGRARASGRPIDLAIVHVWTVREGRIVRFTAYIDTPAMLQALAP